MRQISLAPVDGVHDRLGIAPDTFEAIVFSHGHFDHVMGLDGLARRGARGCRTGALYIVEGAARTRGRAAWRVPAQRRG